MVQGLVTRIDDVIKKGINRSEEERLSELESMQTELMCLRLKHMRIIRENERLIRHLCTSDDDTDDELTDDDDESSQLSSDIEEDLRSWKKELQAYAVEHSCDNVEDVINELTTSLDDQKCEDLVEVNELLRAKLGHLGLPTDGVPEEDNEHSHVRYIGLCAENKLLEAKLKCYTDPESLESERSDDWNINYASIIRAYREIRDLVNATCSDHDDLVLRGMKELQLKYDACLIEREMLKIRLESEREVTEQEVISIEGKVVKLMDENEVLRLKLCMGNQPTAEDTKEDKLLQDQTV